MRNMVFGLIIGILYFSGAQAADLSQPHITVFGEAQEKVAPDRIVWYLNINNRGMDLRDVADAHARIVAGVLTLLSQSGISEDEVQTSHMRFGENWNYRNSSRVKEGYFAATDITFKLTELDRYGDFWIKLSGYEHLSINNVTYEISDEEPYFQKLRQEALLTAREKAHRMAQTLDADIGEPLAIEEETAAPESPYESVRMLSVNAGAQEGKTALAPGKIALHCRVIVTYRLIGTTP